MPAHLALVLAVLYIFTCQWVASGYIKLFRPFSSAVVRNASTPSYWWICLIYCVIMYNGLTFYMNCYVKILMTVWFVYYTVKITAYEMILVYKERMELKEN